MQGNVALRDVQIHLGPQLVLGGVTATVGPGDRLAIVGPNGVGKTTLLRIIAGELAPDAGTVSRSPAHLTVGLLPQERDVRVARPEPASGAGNRPSSLAGETVFDSSWSRTTDVCGRRCARRMWSGCTRAG